MLATAYLGVHVTLHPPENHAKNRYKIGFASCAVIACVLIGIQAWRSDAQQNQNASDLRQVKQDLNKSNEALTRANASLQRSQLSQEFMKGQLSGLSMMVAQQSNNSSSQGVALANALQKISSQKQLAAPAGVEPPAVERFTNKQLKDRVIQLVNAMRQSAVQEQNAERTRMFQNQAEITEAIKKDGNAPRGPASQKAWNDGLVRDQNARAQYSLYVSQNFVTSATEYNTELLRRLGPQPPPSNSDGMARIQEQMLFWNSPPGWTYSTDNVMATAQRLDSLVHKLP